MHNRFFFIPLILILATVLLSAVCALSQENVKAVDDSAFRERMRPKAVFIHDEHNENAGIEDCNKCHHVFDGTQLVEDESSEDRECSACHLSGKQGNLMELANIYHLQCKGCHVENKKGPTMCNECHVKNP